jgi:hypothetical protein
MTTQTKSLYGRDRCAGRDKPGEPRSRNMTVGPTSPGECQRQRTAPLPATRTTLSNAPVLTSNRP